MRTRCILLTALLSAGLLTAQDENSLANLKTAYEAKRTELTAARTATVDKALAAYKAELGTLLANVRQQGNLDYVLAIEAEQKRLEAGGGAPVEPAKKEFPHLRRVQWATRQAEDKADADLAEQAGKLRTQYVAALGKLEKDLVAANRIEEAKAARIEREGVEGAVICGKWLFVGQFTRTINPDGTMTRVDDEVRPDGSWAYLGEGEYRMVTNQGKRVSTATMIDNGNTLEWVAGDGKTYRATRQ